MAALAWWAFRPLPVHDLSLPQTVAAKPAEDSIHLAALDAQAFSTPLWVAPPAPPAPPPPAPPPPPLPPLKLQLIAVVRPPADTEGGYSAIVYDPDADRTIMLKPGDQVGGRKVERITSTAVEFREGAALRTLPLAEAQTSTTPSVAGGVP